MAGPLGIQQLLRMQGIEWSDGVAEKHLYFDGSDLRTDAELVILGSATASTVIDAWPFHGHQIDPTYAGRYADITYNRSVVCLRFDDFRTEDYSVVYPLLTARYLPATFAVNPNKPGTANYSTWAQAQIMQAHGMEMANHSADHDVDPATFQDFQLQTSGAQATFPANSIWTPDTFIQPGTWVGKYEFTDAKLPNQLRELQDLQANFSIAQCYRSINQVGYNSGTYYSLPLVDRWGFSQTSSNTKTISQLQTAVDNASKYGAAITFYFHSFNIGAGGNISLVDFTTFLDYIQTKRDAGLIDVLTVGGSAFARRSATKLSFMSDGDLAAQATSSYLPFTAEAGTPVIASGGHNTNGATNSVAVNSSNYLRRDLIYTNLRRFCVEFWAQSTTGATASPRIVIKNVNSDASEPTGSRVDVTFTNGAPASGTWAKFRVHGCVDQRTNDHLVILFMATASPTCLISDISVYRV